MYGGTLTNVQYLYLYGSVTMLYVGGDCSACIFWTHLKLNY